ncbi:MAG: hypothetical protein KGD59_00315 [Candidatus Heimdallarchaeota archaeon]|nr:hypothetical protein [Candidatus Heimdallarchaeota archaeon]MBY8992963.1 hypothetical protein [Candidatus Heimdallarchaeota archaeon]
MPIARQVMILTKEGLLLLDHKFRVDDGILMETDPDLLSGMLSAILSVAKETTGGLVQTINQDKYNVLISEGEKIYALLFIDEESRELDNIAKLIVGRFEAKYKEELMEIVSDVSVFRTFITDLEEIYAQIFKVDAEVLTKIIPEVTNILNVSIFEKPMNHQVYSGPRDPFVSDYEHYFQEFAVKLIESQAEFSEKTLQFPTRTIMELRNRVIVLEDLGSHVLMVIGENKDVIMSKIKRIRRKAGLQDKNK